MEVSELRVTDGVVGVSSADVLGSVLVLDLLLNSKSIFEVPYSFGWTAGKCYLTLAIF